MKNSLAVPQRVKHRISICFSNSTSRYIPKIIESRDSNTYFTTMFPATLFTIAKSGNNPTVYQWMNELTKYGILFSLKKEWHFHTSYKMNEPIKHYAKWNKIDVKVKMLNNFTYMSYLKKANSLTWKIEVTKGWWEEGMGSYSKSRKFCVGWRECSGNGYW